MGKIKKAISSENRVEILQALQEKLADSLDASKSGVGIAALANQLLRTTTELEELRNVEEPKEEKKTVLHLVRSKHGKTA